MAGTPTTALFGPDLVGLKPSRSLSSFVCFPKDSRVRNRSIAQRGRRKELSGGLQPRLQGPFSNRKFSERAGVIECTSDSSPQETTERIVRIPIFPLGLVPFPATTIPLQIFEARYRVLFSTLLAGEDRVDEELINRDSPFLGSKLFGICLATSQGLSRIGSTVQIKQHVLMEDGKLLVTNRVIERFRILQVVQEKPVVICDVAILTDDEDRNDPKAGELAEEVADLYRSVMQLSQKMGESSVAPEFLDPEELSILDPSDLSFWMASLFDKSMLEQQKILEESSVLKRLGRELDILKGALSFLSAKSALKSAFAAPDPDSPSEEK